MGLVVEIRRLRQRDITGGFSCGTKRDDIRLNRFFDRHAKLNESRRVSATYVAWADETIAGYVTIAPGSVSAKDIPEDAEGLGAYPQPAMVLGRMAVDVRFSGQGVAHRLVREVVFAEALHMADRLGCIGVCVDAKPGAITYYPRHGFRELSRDATTGVARMFVPLETIRAMSTGA